MATQKEIEAAYDYMDEWFRLSFGENADITGAMYNGDFSKTLEQAQEDKRKYILKNIKFKRGDRILDIGSGWGPILKQVHDAGGKAVGLTLSPNQARACRKSGYQVYVQDWKTVNPKTAGKFNGIVSVGAFEHFCSIEEYLAGKQDRIYKDFFKLCADLLPKGGRLYLQTMMWGKEVPDYNKVSLKAPKGSDEWVLALLEKFFPGSWLPSGLKQITKDARPHFKLVSKNNGRLDYIETLNEWTKKNRKPHIKKIWLIIKLIPRLIFDRNFKYQLKSLYHSCNQECFKREIMSHERLVFEKL